MGTRRSLYDAFFWVCLIRSGNRVPQYAAPPHAPPQMPAPAGRRAGDHAGEDPPPGEHDAPAGGSALHRGVLFELQQFDGAAAEHADEGSGGAAADAHGASWGPAQPASKGRWFAGVDLESPIGFVKGLNCSFASGAAAGRDGGEMGDISKKGHGVRRLVPMRRRPAERLASAMIFASFVAVAALVGVICVSSLNAAYQDERNTENLLHDARAFVPAKTGGTLPIDSFEDVQRPKGHVWAEHNFDTDFIDGDLGQEGASSPGRTQQLTNVPRPGHTIEAHVPGDHLHGKRVWGWLHKDKNSAAGHESSAAIQENLDKQADYIIGYPDLGKDEAARTQRLVGLRDPAAAERLGKLPPLGGRPKAAESVKNAQKVLACDSLHAPHFSDCAGCVVLTVAFDLASRLSKRSKVSSTGLLETCQRSKSLGELASERAQPGILLLCDFRRWQGVRGSEADTDVCTTLTSAPRCHREQNLPDRGMCCCVEMSCVCWQARRCAQFYFGFQIQESR